MLIDEFMPEYQFSERHQMVVKAPAAVVRRAAEEWRPDESLLWRALLRLRGLGRPAGTLREWGEGTGFLRLAETDEEIVYGQAGRFWELRERSALESPRTAEDFRAFSDPRSAVAVFNLHGEPLAPDRTLLSTETRVNALSPQARRRFRLYWLLIRPFSGLLRRAMLRGIAARALAASRSAPAR